MTLAEVFANPDLKALLDQTARMGIPIDMSQFGVTDPNATWASVSAQQTSDGVPQKLAAPGTGGGWGSSTGYDEMGNYVGNQADPHAPYSQWALNHGYADLETRISQGKATPQDIAFMGQLSSVDPNAGPQAMWNDFVARVQDKESGPGMLGINELATIENDPFAQFLATVGGSISGPAIAGAAGGGMTGAAAAGGALGGTSSALSGGSPSDIATAALIGAGTGAAGNYLLGGTPQVVAPTEAPTSLAGSPIQLADSGLTMTDVSPGLQETQMPPAVPERDAAGVWNNIGGNTFTQAPSVTLPQTPSIGTFDVGGPVNVTQPTPTPTVDLTQTAQPAQTPSIGTVDLTQQQPTIASLGGDTTAPSLGGDLGSGIKLPTPTTSIGGGDLGTGLTPGATATGGITTTGANLTGTPLGTNFFPSENAAPVIGGQTAAASSGVAGQTGSGTTGGLPPTATATATGIGGMTLQKLLSGEVGLDDLGKSLTLGDLGKILGTAGSVYGANEAANKYSDLADKYMALGQPSRERYEASFGKDFDINSLPGLQGAMDTSYQSILRGLSTRGNPFGSPGGLAEALKYVSGNVALPYLNQFRNQNAATGGYGAFSTAAPGMAGTSVKAGGDVYADLGRGIASLTNPPTTLEQALRSLRSLT